MKLQGNGAATADATTSSINILGTLEVEVLRVTVTELRENTFYAVDHDPSTTARSSRSTRARPTRLRSPVAHRCADLRRRRVIDESAIEFEGRGRRRRRCGSAPMLAHALDLDPAEFRAFLDQPVTPDQFAEAEILDEETETDDDLLTVRIR